MSNENVTARNRANAQQSTGPKTPDGKAVVARNALKHGATARPDPVSVAAWLAIILDRPDITPDDILPGDDVGYRAIALAEAEVRLVAAETAIREFDADRDDPSEEMKDLGRCRDIIMDELHRKDGNKKAIRSAASLLARVLKLEMSNRNKIARRYRLLMRYESEARSERRKAFEAWVLAREGAPISTA